MSKDLEIAEITKGKIHIPHVSTKRSVDLIRKYKKMGVNVTAEVTPHHIGLTENKLTEYDTHTKVAPPLRSELDRKALIKGLLEGSMRNDWFGVCLWIEPYRTYKGWRINGEGCSMVYKRSCRHNGMEHHSFPNW